MTRLLCATISITKTAKACNLTAILYSISLAHLTTRIKACRLSVNFPIASECYSIYLKIYFPILIALCPHAKSKFLSITSIITKTNNLKGLLKIYTICNMFQAYIDVLYNTRLSFYVATSCILLKK